MSHHRRPPTVNRRVGSSTHADLCRPLTIGPPAGKMDIHGRDCARVGYRYRAAGPHQRDCRLAAEVELLRRHERTGRPLGEVAFVDQIEQTLHRIVRPAKRGPKPMEK